MMEAKKRSVQEYEDLHGRNPYKKWFDDLNYHAATKVAVALARLKQGNLSNVKALRRGVFELRIHFGPGYRIYFGKDGDTLIVLLGGGTEKRQSGDINRAERRWQQYLRRRTG